MIRNLMIFRFIVGLLIGMILCSCALSPSEGDSKINSGLLIDNGINRGVGYTDSLGSKFNVRYIPITITNDSTIPIHIQVAFSKEYNRSRWINPDS